MAIKKQLFDQYIQEQESFTTLRSKKTALNQKYSHNRVFDEPPSLKNSFDFSNTKQPSNVDLNNGSQTVHTSSSPIGMDETIIEQQQDTNSNNGSQTVHTSSSPIGMDETIIEQQQDTNSNNGSQTVHTSSSPIGMDETIIEQQQDTNSNNGSQTVHTSSSPIGMDETIIEQQQDTNSNNGSQTVHTSSSPIGMDETIIEQQQDTNSNNGSQTVHTSSSPIGMDETIIEQQQDTNSNNGSQTVHTSSSPIGMDETIIEQQQDTNSNNGSQTVHTSSSPIGMDETIIEQQQDTNSNNGSQTVHTSSSPIGMDETIIEQHQNVNSNGDSQMLHKSSNPGGANTTTTKQSHDIDINNGSRTVHERFTQPITNGSQTVHEAPISSETVHKPNTQPATNGSRTVHNNVDFSSLPYLQRNLLKALYTNSQISGTRTTQRLNLSYISEISNVKKTSLKNTIWRLKDKGFIKTKEYKDGRGGWVVYEIPKEVFLEILTAENGSRTVHERFTKPNTQPPLYNNNLNTTIIESELEASLPKEWQQINISPLQEQGLSERQLLDLYRANITTAEIVQQSINHYAWGLKNNSDSYVKYKNHIFVLIGILRKGGIWTESGYESPQEIALKELIESKKQQNKKYEELIEQLIELEFPEWESSLTKKDIKKISPLHSSLDRLSAVKLLKAHFRKEILIPRLKREGRTG